MQHNPDDIWTRPNPEFIDDEHVTDDLRDQAALILTGVMNKAKQSSWLGDFLPTLQTESKKDKETSSSEGEGKMSVTSDSLWCIPTGRDEKKASVIKSWMGGSAPRSVLATTKARRQRKTSSQSRPRRWGTHLVISTIGPTVSGNYGSRQESILADHLSSSSTSNSGCSRKFASRIHTYAKQLWQPARSPERALMMLMMMKMPLMATQQLMEASSWITPTSKLGKRTSIPPSWAKPHQRWRTNQQWWNHSCHQRQTLTDVARWPKHWQEGLLLETPPYNVH